jgi:hypothetical protein
MQWAESRLNPEYILPSHCELENVVGYLVEKGTVRLDDENVITAVCENPKDCLNGRLGKKIMCALSSIPECGVVRVPRRCRYCGGCCGIVQGVM